MKTETKIERIKSFFSTKNNELFKIHSNPITLSVLFDIEFSKNQKHIGFSTCLKVENYNEAIKILEKVTTNISKVDLKEKLTQKIDSTSINKDECFYLIIKGNKLKK
jgi:hypothetical protein